MRFAAQAVLLLATASVVAGCREPDAASVERLPEVEDALSEYGLHVEAAPTSIVALAWQPPAEDCDHVYRLSVHYEPALLHESDHVDHLVLGHPDDPDRRQPKGALTAEQLFEGDLYYSGYRAERRGVARDWSMSGTMLGPAAPTAACYPRTWDPIEDAFALGFPKLPAGLAAVGETWNGLRVEGKCNRSACVDPKTGGGGPENHHRTCVTPPWRVRLAGIYDVGPDRLALIEQTWDDGHQEGGIQAEGLALVSSAHGRPLWARVVVHHGFNQMTADKTWAPIRRTWTLEAIDACEGSLVDLGWERPLEVKNAEALAIDGFQRREELLRGRPRSEPDSAQPETNPSEEGVGAGR